jgi:maltose alpha-D-glucosyltransferase/alpha-amylase
MQWSAEPHAGFTTSNKPVLPVIAKGEYGFKRVNAAQQRREPNSLLNWMERMIRMRKEVPEIGWGDFTVLDTGTSEVLALRYDWRNNAVVVLHNFAHVAKKITMSVTRRGLGSSAPDDDLLVNVFSEDHSRGKDGEHRITLEPYGYRWYRVGGLDDLLRRSTI